MTQLAPMCPIDNVPLVPMQGSEEFLFICTGGCKKTWMRRTTGELEEALAPPLPLSFVPKFLIDQLYAKTDASVAHLESSSTGLVDRLTRVETALSDLAAKAPAADRRELEAIRQDARSALDSARGAQGAARIVQDNVTSLKKVIDDLDVASLRSSLDAVETLVRKHLKDHKDGNV